MNQETVEGLHLLLDAFVVTGIITKKQEEHGDLNLGASVVV